MRLCAILRNLHPCSEATINSSFATVRDEPRVGTNQIRIISTCHIWQSSLTSPATYTPSHADSRPVSTP